MKNENETVLKTNEGSAKTDNELIAEFMGIKVAPYEHWAAGKVIAIVPEEGIIDYPQLNVYNPSIDWNQLMPVVEKINKVVGAYPSFPVEYIELTELSIFIKIDRLHVYVVNFIKWYNSERGG